MCVFCIPVPVPGLARHAVLLTPQLSLRQSQLPRYNQNKHSNFHSPYTLPSSLSCKSFACHSCENCRGVYQQFPFRDSPLATRAHESHVSHAPAARKDQVAAADYRSKFFNCNTYGPPRKCCKQKAYCLAKPFKCTTYAKHGEGATYCYLENPRCRNGYALPQRWGQLRKGRTVFRREDRVQLLNQLSAGGGGGASGPP
jgi:hypothetical protein